MFERDRIPPEKFPTTPNIETDEFVAYEKLDKRLEKRLKRRSRMPMKIGAVALAFAAVGSVYWADVEENRAERAEARVSIDVVGEPLDEANSDRGIIFVDGFNTNNGEYLAKTIGPAVQEMADGKLLSLATHNAVLAREQIVEEIQETVEENKLERVIIVGNSMGGIIDMEAVSDLVDKSDVKVDLFILMHTPSGPEGLQTKPKVELEFLQELVKWFPGAIDSTYLRYGGELYFYKDIYTKGEFKSWDINHNIGVIGDNIGRLFRTSDSLWKKVNRPTGTSLQLMLEQGYKIDNFDMEKELKTIAAQRGAKQMPVGLYLSMDNDSTVKNKEAAQNFTVMTHENDIKFHTYNVPNAIHAQYDRSIKEYTQAFEKMSGVISRDVQEEKDKHEAYLIYQDEISIEAKG